MTIYLGVERLMLPLGASVLNNSALMWNPSGAVSALHVEVFSDTGVETVDYLSVDVYGPATSGPPRYATQLTPENAIGPFAITACLTWHAVPIPWSNISNQFLVARIAPRGEHPAATHLDSDRLTAIRAIGI